MMNTMVKTIWTVLLMIGVNLTALAGQRNNESDVWDGKDMTQYIVNPTFETSTTKNTGNSTGWTVERGTGDGNITPGPINGAGDTFLEKCGFYNACFESWHRYNWDVWQEITGLPVGMYELEVQGYVRCEVYGYIKGDELGEDYPSPVYLYMNNAMSQFPSVYSEIPAENGIDEFQIVESWTLEEINGNYFPNSMGGAAQCFYIDKEVGREGMYKTTAYGLIAREGDVFRIGVKMDADQDWWCIFDNFKLTYREPKADVVKPVLEDALGSIDTSKPMGKNIVTLIGEIQTIAAEVLDGTDGQAMFEILAQVYDLTVDISTSVELFAMLSAANRDLENAAYDSQSAAASEALALVNNINSGIENHTIDDAEVDGLIEQIDKMNTKLNMPDDMAQATDDYPKECTGVIKTPSFEDEYWNNSAAGWNNPGSFGSDETQKSVYAIEFWQTNFDMYQTIKGLPKGTYQLMVDAWCRIGDDQQNYEAWMADNGATMAYAYAVDGDNTVYAAPVANVMKGALTESYGYEGEVEFTVDDVTYYMPGSLFSGRMYMEDSNWGVYTNSVICKVGDDGQLTIGIKKDETMPLSWVVCDNFRLFYYGDGSSQQPSGDASSGNVGPNKMVVPSLNSMYGNAQLPINIENTDEIVAMQFDLTLPEGITLKGNPTLTSRCDDHSVTVLSIASRVYRVMLYSDRNRRLKGESGTVFYLPITISEDIPSESELSVQIDEPVLSKVTGENVLTELEVGTIYVTSIPFPEIVNPGFELSEAVTTNLGVSSSKGGTDYETSGWKLLGTTNYTNSGVFAYGSDYTLNSVRTPDGDNNGAAGNALGFTSGWNYSLVYQSSEPVLIPRGTYALLAYVYNANPDAEQMVSKLGFVSSEGQSYLSSVNSYVSGEWTIDYVVFTLKAATEGVFQVGCTSRYASPSSNAIPFFDNLLLTDEQDLTARMIAVQMAHFPESYGEGKAMASLVTDYNAARQQIAAATNIQDVMASARTTQQKLTAIKDYISAMDNLAQAIQDVEGAKLSQATLTEACSLENGLVEGTLYTNDQIGQLKTDVNDIISRLNSSVSLYRQLNGALTSLTNVLATPGPDTRLGLADEINSATDLLTTNTTGYEEGSIGDGDVQAICGQLQTLAEELADKIANYVDATEWLVLKTVYEQRGEAENWTRKWDFSRGKPWKTDLSGVDVNDGHVVGLRLSSNNMSGDVPLTVLGLPQLQSLNLSGNHLTGLGSAIPVQVTSLSLGNQSMDYVADVSLHDIVTGSMTAQLPTIIQYNHSTQSFDAPLRLNCTTEDRSWSMVVNRQGDGTVSISSIQPYAYTGANGEMLSVRNSNDGSTFTIRFSFDEGDSNFDGVVNLYDLQTTINYAMEDYANKPFNFTAANLWVDELINVQDVIRTVSVLMEMDVSNGEGASPYTQAPARTTYGETPDVKAMLYIQDGYLMLNTDVPVAAFDFMLEGDAGVAVSKALKGLDITYRMERQASGTRIIGYSLTGGVLPVGKTAICKVDAGATVVHALLSDAEALPIGVAFGSGQATGIVEMENGSQDNTGEAYDLQGRRVNPRSGANRPIIVIQNGRKVVK